MGQRLLPGPKHTVIHRRPREARAFILERAIAHVHPLLQRSLSPDTTDRKGLGPHQPMRATGLDIDCQPAGLARFARRPEIPTGHRWEGVRQRRASLPEIEHGQGLEAIGTRQSAVQFQGRAHLSHGPAAIPACHVSAVSGSKAVPGDGVSADEVPVLTRKGLPLERTADLRGGIKTVDPGIRGTRPGRNPHRRRRRSHRPGRCDFLCIGRTASSSSPAVDTIPGGGSGSGRPPCQRRHDRRHLRRRTRPSPTSGSASSPPDARLASPSHRNRSHRSRHNPGRPRRPPRSGMHRGVGVIAVPSAAVAIAVCVVHLPARIGTGGSTALPPRHDMHPVRARRRGWTGNGASSLPPRHPAHTAYRGVEPDAAGLTVRRWAHRPTGPVHSRRACSDRSCIHAGWTTGSRRTC